MMQLSKAVVVALLAAISAVPSVSACGLCNQTVCDTIVACNVSHPFLCFELSGGTGGQACSNETWNGVTCNECCDRSSCNSGSSSSSSSHSAATSRSTTSTGGSSSSSTGGAGTPSPTTTGTPSPPTAADTTSAADANATSSGITDTTPAPIVLDKRQRIEWYIVVVAIVAVFVLIGASCYVMCMWQQKAIRDYNAKFEEEIKERGINRRKLEDELRDREEKAYRRAERRRRGEDLWSSSDDDSDETDSEDKEDSEDSDDVAETKALRRKQKRIEKQREKEAKGPNKYELVLQRKKEEEEAKKQAALLHLPNNEGIKKEDISTARRGPMMIQRSALAATGGGGGGAIPSSVPLYAGNVLDDNYHNRANQLLATLKDKDRKKVVEERNSGSVEKGLSFTSAAHSNLRSLKNSSQLRNVQGLDQ